MKKMFQIGLVKTFCLVKRKPKITILLINITVIFYLKVEEAETSLNEDSIMGDSVSNEVKQKSKSCLF